MPLGETITHAKIVKIPLIEAVQGCESIRSISEPVILRLMLVFNWSVSLNVLTNLDEFRGEQKNYSMQQSVRTSFPSFDRPQLASRQPSAAALKSAV